MIIPHITEAQANALGLVTMRCNTLIDAANEALKPRTTVNGESMTAEAAQKLFEETKDTHDWFWGSTADAMPAKTDCPEFLGFNVYEYELKAPKLKQIDWSNVPVGVMTNKGEIVSIDLFRAWTLNELRNGLHNFGTCDLRLAPASEQPWLYWGGGECPVPEGCTYEAKLRNKEIRTDVFSWKHGDGLKVVVSCEIIAYRITGLAEGYTDGGAV